MKQLDKTQQDIMDYVADEMSRNDKLHFEEKMQADKKLRDEVAQFKEVQSNLGEWVDRDVSFPKIHLPDIKEGKQMRRWPLSLWMRIAASLLILFIMSWATDLQLTKSSNALTFSFGPVQKVDKVDEAMIHELVHEVVNSYNEDRNQQLGVLEKRDWQSAMVEQGDLIKRIEGQDRKLDQFGQQLVTYEPVQMEKIYEALEYMNEKQKKDISEMMSSLMEYWESQRENDLVKIENAFQKIDRTLSAQRFENEQWLNNLLTTNNY